MLGRFAIRHFCSGFLDRKIECLNGESDDLF